MSTARALTNQLGPLATGEKRLIALESLQWCAVNAVYFLGLIGAATYELGGDAFLVAAITLVRNLCNSLANAAAGPVIDRVGPRKTALITLVAMLVMSVFMGIVPPSVPTLMFAAVMMGLGGGSINTCTRTYPVYLAQGRARLARLNGLMVFYSNIAYAAGPIAGGVLAGLFPTRVVFLFMAVCLVGAIAVTWGCRETVTPPREENSKLKDDKLGVVSGVIEGARITMRTHDLRLIFVSGFLGFFAFGAFDSLESLFYRDVLVVDVVWMGVLSAVSGVGMAIGSYIFTKIPERKIDVPLLLATLAFVGIGSMIYVGTNILAVAIVGQFINGLAWGFMEPTQAILVQERTPMTHLGRVMGFVRLGLNSAGVIPLAIAPFLAATFGVQGVLFGASCIIAAVGISTYAVRRMSEHRAEEERVAQ
ncbi:MFS transporter [Enorma phocaeensis]|uniref:MFS transporter n=1 Tax=Enorma phocaeensis TaxID=1871019 RepID=A0ABT7VAG9_9ACTN|nr:MFS transporter [Enorma phocaeensis]MDM8275389.1 MFS transporter [Enorma phocaeensis]